MSEEINQVAEAPVSDAPAPELVASEPVSSEPTSDAEMSAEMGRTFNEIEKTDPYRALPEWKPEAEPQSVAPELPGQEHKIPGDAIQPPVSLNAKAREIWSTLPRDAQALWAQREQEANAKITELGTYARAARELGQVFEEFREHLPKAEDGQTIPERDTVRLLLAAHKALEEDPERALRWLAENKGVSLNGLGEADKEQMQQRAYAEAQQQFQQQQEWQSKKQEWDQYQRQTQRVHAHVEAFTRDKPHWDQIEADVLYFIPAEKANNPHGEPTEWFQAAYNKAMAGRPDLDSTKKAESKRAADQARRIASMNVKSDGSWVARRGGNWQDDLGRIYDSIQSRGR